jgi:hypothetical protein
LLYSSFLWEEKVLMACERCVHISLVEWMNSQNTDHFVLPVVVFKLAVVFNFLRPVNTTWRRNDLLWRKKH